MIHLTFTCFHVMVYNNDNSQLFFLLLFLNTAVVERGKCRADFIFTQCETSFQSNSVFHWLGANLESALKCWKVVHPKHDIWIHAKSRYIYRCWRQAIVTSNWRWNVDFRHSYIHPTNNYNYLKIVVVIIYPRPLSQAVCAKGDPGISERFACDI